MSTPLAISMLLSKYCPHHFILPTQIPRPKASSILAIHNIHMRKYRLSISAWLRRASFHIPISSFSVALEPVPPEKLDGGLLYGPVANRSIGDFAASLGRDGNIRGFAPAET